MTLLRTFLHAFCLFALPFFAQGQNLRKHQFGVHAGVSVTQLSLAPSHKGVWEGAGSEATFTAGLAYTRYFTFRWGIQLEANYLDVRAAGKQHSLVYKVYARGFSDTLELLTGDPRFREAYVYTPVMVCFAVDARRRFCVAAGPHFQWFLKSKSTFVYESEVYGTYDPGSTPEYTAFNPPKAGPDVHYVRPERNIPGFSVALQYSPMIGDRQFLWLNAGLLYNFGDFLGIRRKEFVFRVGYVF